MSIFCINQRPQFLPAKKIPSRGCGEKSGSVILVFKTLFANTFDFHFANEQRVDKREGWGDCGFMGSGGWGLLAALVPLCYRPGFAYHCTSDGFMPAQQSELKYLFAL